MLFRSTEQGLNKVRGLGRRDPRGQAPPDGPVGHRAMPDSSSTAVGSMIRANTYCRNLVPTGRVG